MASRCHRVSPLAGLVLALAIPHSVESQGSASSTGVSNASNPATSINALFLAVRDSHDETEDSPEGEHGHATAGSGLHLQELELQFTSFVDPYWKADIILAVPGGEGVEVEEGFVTSLALPGNLQLKAGKFYAELGRQNLLHTHAYALVDAPLVHGHLLGDEGLSETGLSLSWLTPMPWFVELTGQVLDGANERFDSDDGEDLLYLGHLKSFHEPHDAITVEAGLSGAAGANRAEDLVTMLGADLTVKWQPLRAGARRSLIWQSEYLRARDDGGGSEVEDGLYSQLQYQFARRWWVTSRIDMLDLSRRGSERDWRASMLVALVPSEFSSLRLQYNRTREEGETRNQLLLQLNVTIGSHPAHRY